MGLKLKGPTSTYRQWTNYSIQTMEQKYRNKKKHTTDSLHCELIFQRSVLNNMFKLGYYIISFIESYKKDKQICVMNHTEN